jgi:hypothetical protein
MPLLIGLRQREILRLRPASCDCAPCALRQHRAPVRVQGPARDIIGRDAIVRDPSTPSREVRGTPLRMTVIPSHLSPHVLRLALRSAQSSLLMTSNLAKVRQPSWRGTFARLVTVPVSR